MSSKINALLGVAIVGVMASGGYYWWSCTQREERSVNEFYLFLRESNEIFTQLSFAGCTAATEDDVRKNPGVQLGDVVLKLRRGNEQVRDFPITSLLTSLQGTSGFPLLRDRFRRLGLDYYKIPRKSCSPWEKAFSAREVATNR